MISAEIDGPGIEQDELVTSVENGKLLEPFAISTSQVHSRKSFPPGLTWTCHICNIVHAFEVLYVINQQLN